MSDNNGFDPHGTTIVAVRRNGAVAMGGDGQVTLGNDRFHHVGFGHLCRNVHWFTSLRETKWPMR